MSSGLALLASYSDEESEEEKPQTVERLSPPAKKKKLILQNPMKNVQIGASDPEFVDDPSLHDNRIRSFPHVRGNWASYIFIDPQNEIDFGPLQNSILKFLAENHSSLECKTINGPHLSVSRVFTLQFHWISSFVQELQTKLKNNVKPFNLSLAPKIDLLINEESTRTFITVAIPEHKSLIDVVKCCDKTLLEFDKEVFYKPATFHISLAWVLGDQRDQIDIKNLQSCLEKIEESTFHVDSICCKIGNKLYTSKL